MSGAATSRGNRRRLAVALAVVTLLAYWPTLDNGFIWDDDDYVTENETLRSAEGLAKIWFDYSATPQYYPMVHTTFWVEYQLWQLDPAGYHLVNLCLHALASVLLFAVLGALGIPGAWLGAAIFAVHPVHVESVAWVTERKNVLSAVFYLASLYAYLRSAGLGVASAEAERGNRWYAASLVCFVAALLSKTVVGSLPAVILLLVWFRRGRIAARDVWPLAPYFLLALVFGLLTAQLETEHVGAVGREWELSLSERLQIAGRALWFYAAKLVWPAKLAFNYPHFDVDPRSPTAWLYPAGALAVVATLFSLRARLGRGPVVAVLIFGGTLFPALGFIDVYPMRYSYVADHYQYLASIGLIALFAAACARAAAGLRLRPVAVRFAAVMMLALLGALTWHRTHAYRDAETLWNDTLAANPESWFALSHLGVLAADRGEVETAIGYYRRSLAIEPRQRESYNNLGTALHARGDLVAARAALERALAVDPDYPLAHNSLGLVLHDQGDHAAARAAFERALAVDPGFAPAHTNLGVTLAAIGDDEGALKHHRAAIGFAPDLAAAHSNLAAVLIARGEFDAAIAALTRAVALEPDSKQARRNLKAARRLKAQSRNSPPPTRP